MSSLYYLGFFLGHLWCGTGFQNEGLEREKEGKRVRKKETETECIVFFIRALEVKLRHFHCTLFGKIAARPPQSPRRKRDVGRVFKVFISHVSKSPQIYVPCKVSQQRSLKYCKIHEIFTFKSVNPLRIMSLHFHVIKNLINIVIYLFLAILNERFFKYKKVSQFDTIYIIPDF